MRKTLQNFKEKKVTNISKWFKKGNFLSKKFKTKLKIQIRAEKLEKIQNKYGQDQIFRFKRLYKRKRRQMCPRRKFVKINKSASPMQRV